MGGVFKLIWWVVIGLFRSRASLEAEIVALLLYIERWLKAPGHQLNVLRTFDRLFFAILYRIAPRVAVLIGPLPSERLFPRVNTIVSLQGRTLICVAMSDEQPILWSPRS